MIYRKFTSLNR